MMVIRLALYTLIVATTACNFTGYGDSQVPVIQPGVTAKTEHQPEQQAEAGREAVTHSARPSPPLTSGQAGACPDNEVARLMVAGDFERAKALLDEDLGRARDEMQRSCILTSMGMLAAVPNSDLYDPEQAQDYQDLARVNGVVENGSLALQLLDTSLGNLIALQQQLQVLGSDNDRLKEQLEAKGEALRKLKNLTLGNH